MIAQPILAAVAVAAAAATVVWARSSARLHRVWRRVAERVGPDAEAAVVARASWRKDLHTTLLYGTLAAGATVASLSTGPAFDAAFLLVLAPVVATFTWGRGFSREARLFEGRTRLEERAEQVLSQEDLAPRRWAARLAPEDLPDVAGFEIGAAYQAGAGMMAGDFYDLFRSGSGRLVAAIGDVAGHGIEPSITAFQTKYLLRLLLRQYRDPAQALEELNAQLSALERGEEFVSLFVAVFDTEAATLRYASAGHPPGWVWHDREVQPLGATGPLLTLDAEAGYHSRELPLDRGDMLVLYTDGLSEVRNGSQLFGEERIEAAVRRDPDARPEVLCKSLLETAQDFGSGPLRDDVAILAVRRS